MALTTLNAYEVIFDRKRKVKKRLVGTGGFEPTTPCTPCKCATRLRYAPTKNHTADALSDLAENYITSTHF